MYNLIKKVGEKILNETTVWDEKYIEKLYAYFCNLEVKTEFCKKKIANRQMDVWEFWNTLSKNKFEYFLWKILTGVLDIQKIVMFCGTASIANNLIMTLNRFDILVLENNKILISDNIQKLYSCLEKSEPIEVAAFKNKRIFAQLSCTWESSISRAQYLEKNVPPFWPIIFLGDDDFTSIVLAESYYRDISVVDIDQNILKIIKENSNNIKTYLYDIKGVNTISDKFKCVHMDPADDSNGLEIWIGRALELLTGEIGDLIFLNINPVRIGKREKFLQEYFIREGFLIKDRINNFSSYKLSEDPSFTDDESYPEYFLGIEIFTDLLVFERVVKENVLFPNTFFNKRRRL